MHKSAKKANFATRILAQARMRQTNWASFYVLSLSPSARQMKPPNPIKLG